MTSFVVNGLSTTARTLINGETGFVAEGSELLVTGVDAIDGSGANQLVILGNVTTFGNFEAIDFDGTDIDIFVGAAGSIIAASDTAVDLFGSGRMELSNAGSILADGTAVSLAASDTGADVNFLNSGVVNGSSAVFVSSGNSLAIIDNSGILQSNGTTIIVSSSTGATLLNNSGTISSGTGAAVSLSSGNDVVINSGTIIGSVSLSTGDDLYDGSGGLHVVGGIIGGGGDDTLIGGDGAELLAGSGGDDEIFGNGGNDTINASIDQGNDTIDGGDGLDTVDYGSDTSRLTINLNLGFASGGFSGVDELISIERIISGNGNDRLIGDGGRNVIKGQSGDDKIIGNDGRDRLLGGAGEDTLRGGAGNDHLNGGADDDRLVGRNGNDVMIGGEGADDMNGGDGADTFVYLSVADSGLPIKSRDVIEDFKKGTDIIDFAAIDADTTDAVDSEFVFIGTAPFSGTPGEVRFRQTATTTIVSINVDADTNADMHIILDGVINLTGSDFIL